MSSLDRGFCLTEMTGICSLDLLDFLDWVSFFSDRSLAGLAVFVKEILSYLLGDVLTSTTSFGECGLSSSARGGVGALFSAFSS